MNGSSTANPSIGPDNGRPIRGFISPIAIGERLIGWSLGLLLLRSAFVHLGNPYYFLSTVYSYQILEVEGGKWVTLLLPYVQMILAVCFLAKWWLKEAYFGAILVFGCFGVVQLVAWGRGLGISCGCFGATESLQVGWSTVLLAVSADVAATVGLMLRFVQEWNLQRVVSQEDRP
jgi:putative oxidoreductase